MSIGRGRANLDPIYRAVYALQAVGALALVAGLFLTWWDAAEPQTALDLMGSTLGPVRERDLGAAGQPLLVLWLIWPFWVVAGLRALTGLVVPLVAFRRLAAALGVLALAAVGHFRVAYGDDLAANSPLKDGSIGLGFWLTAGGVAALLGLILVEMLVRAPDPNDGLRRRPAGPAAPARVERGEYIACPHCGSLNEPEARTCYNCHIRLFNFPDTS